LSPSKTSPRFSNWLISSCRILGSGAQETRAFRTWVGASSFNGQTATETGMSSHYPLHWAWSPTADASNKHAPVHLPMGKSGLGYASIQHFLPKVAQPGYVHGKPALVSSQP
jgi:hypothetical protein